MDVDDPRRPLLADATSQRSVRPATASWRRHLPITIWLSSYSIDYLARDFIAGLTVGLTSIPQGIAYAIIAGLPPQVGLYSTIFPGLVYMVLGSCKEVIVGPTAILAALLTKYVEKSEDFAYLATFLTGCVILILGILQLGFLLDFVSRPVISAFTTAAALQIGASQLKSLFGAEGSSGGAFVSALVKFFKHVKTIRLWDTVLGVVCIATLFMFKFLTVKSGRGQLLAEVSQHLVRARNAIVVFAATLLAYALHLRGLTPFKLTGKIDGGLPDFKPPPFSTRVGNETRNFGQMLEVFGPEGFVMPLVAILESIAIAKAFGGVRVDATQEMVAVGACNVVAACARAMPAAGSFTRTALCHAAGVRTPAASFFKAALVLAATCWMAEAFRLLPRAALAAVILTAMANLIELRVVNTLWTHSKCELGVYLVTLVTGVVCGLEYGILCGAGADALRVLAASARPRMPARTMKVGGIECCIVELPERLQYACAQRAASGACRPRGGARMSLCPPSSSATDAPRVLIIDAARLRCLDLGVAEELVRGVAEQESEGRSVLIWNMSEHLQRLVDVLRPGLTLRHVQGSSVDQHVLDLSAELKSDHPAV